MDMTMEARPPTVAATPTQGGDIRSRWSWVEPSVWTDGMLAALENGVKGGKWYSVIDKVWSPRSLEAGFRKVDGLLKAGQGWVVDADIKGYFDSIPHDKLLMEVEKEIADGRFLKLIRLFLEAKVMDGLAEWTPEKGTPQGAVLSPVLANIYLNPFDHLMEAKGFKTVRYADDFVVLCGTKAEAEAALEVIREWMAGAGLELHPEKTRIVNAGAGDSFEFLGYRFEKGRRWPRKKSLGKLKDKVRQMTKRVNGRSLDAIIAKLNLCLRGWFNYFKHSRKYIFKDLELLLRLSGSTVQRFMVGSPSSLFLNR